MTIINSYHVWCSVAFGRLQNTGRALGAAGKKEARECYSLIVWRKWIHWDEIEPKT